MALGLIGQKIGMTQVFTEEGEAVPVTIIEAGPCTVITKKSQDKHGYNALQVGFGTQKESRMSKPELGQFKKANVPPAKTLREFRVEDIESYEVGQALTVEMFEVGEKINVTGRSKGRGFAGVIKRHGFHGGRKTHGSMFHRIPGSIGASATPARVYKGTKLPGHYGDARTTLKNVTIVDLKPDQNLLLVRGSIPGGKNGFVVIKKQNS
jgi:large subunit ribosomal protein L3